MAGERLILRRPPDCSVSFAPSLRISGWHLVGTRGGGSWNCPSRPRVETPNQGQKLLWEIS